MLCVAQQLYKALYKKPSIAISTTGKNNVHLLKINSNKNNDRNERIKEKDKKTVTATSAAAAAAITNSHAFRSTNFAMS